MGQASWQLAAITVAQYIIYLVIIKATGDIPKLVYSAVYSGDWSGVIKKLQDNWSIICFLIGSLLTVNHLGGSVFEKDFIFLFIAHTAITLPNMDKITSIKYGVGMACSLYEGYLAHVLPNDGSSCVGFHGNIKLYESKHGVTFPVKKLFLIIPKKLYCPPDLKDFNKPNQPIYLEACESLEEVEKDVAGVKNRTYRNAAYKIHRPDGDPVYIAAECATPLHTLHKVMQRKALYKDLMDADFDEIVNDFQIMLQKILDNSPDCYDKCELVCFDDSDPKLNLAEFLLQRIAKIEPNFDKLKHS